MPLQFTYSERCHYNSFEPSNMPFSTYLILLDPRAGSGIFVWTKMPCCLSTLHSLTYGPHMSASSSSFLSSPAAVAALHPQAPARTPRPCARAPAASSEVEKTAVVGAAPAQAPESPPASRARWRGYLTTVAPPASSRPSGAGPARLSRPSRAGESGAERQRTGQARNGEAACELPRQFQRRRSVRAPSAAQASPGAAPFGVHARAPPRCSGSAPELGVLHRQRPSAPPRRAELAHAEPLLPDPHALAGAGASRSPALRPRARRRCGHARSSLRRSRPPRAEEGGAGEALV